MRSSNVIYRYALPEMAKRISGISMKNVVREFLIAGKKRKTRTVAKERWIPR